MRITLPTLSEMTDNIVAVASAATDTQLAIGRGWYNRARTLAVELDSANPRKAAAVIAALSPRMPWDRNVTLAREAYRFGMLNGGALSANVAKVNRIMNGESPDTVISAKTAFKTSAFFQTIANPADATLVTVDRHALAIALGRPATNDELGQLSNLGIYTAVSDAYRAAAIILGWMPSEVQAVTWTVWRDGHATGWAKRDTV